MQCRYLMKMHVSNRNSRPGVVLSTRSWALLRGSLAFACIWGALTAQSGVIPPSAQVTPDLSKPGFVWTVFANSADPATSVARADAALSGGLKDVTGDLLSNRADHTAQGAAIAPATPPNPDNAPIRFEIAEVINLSQSADTAKGNFTPDLQMPGIPATDGWSDGISADIVTYLELPAGTITMGVNSDDGFRTVAGDLNDALRRVSLGAYAGPRGSADSLFTFQVAEAGVYPFRTTYYEGGGDANIEWFTVQEGVKILLNDTAKGGLKAYRAAAIPPRNPYVQFVSPPPALRQLNPVTSSVVVVLADGDTDAIDDRTINFKVDGVPVTDQRREGKTVTLTHVFTGIQFPSETHTATLTFQGVGGFTRTESWGFKNIKNVILPAPVLIENFDSYVEGSAPTGWVATHFTAPCDEGDDLQNQSSTPYMNWLVIGTGTIPSIDSSGINDVNAAETVNGQPLTLEMLRSGKVLYAESDGRCPGDARADVIAGAAPGPHGQTQFIVTKPFNLSAVKDPVLSFGAGYMQNQNSFGGVEYSVDGGVTYLPILYYLDEPALVVAADGTTDGVATLTSRQSADTSVWVDNDVVKGEAWGDAVAAPIKADIGNYLVPRLNDDGADGKRIEIARLPAAANQADVRLRFSATGSDSWYFFIDNVAFYDIPAPIVPEVSVVSSATLDGLYTAESSATASGPDTFTVPINGAVRYFRLDGAARIRSVRVDGANLILTY